MPDTTTHSRIVEVPSGAIELRWAAATDTGRRRDVNQDALLAQYPLFIVADGMGGHIGGEIASASAIERLRTVAERGSVTPEDLEEALERAVGDIADHPETTDEGTGTTVTGVYLDVVDGEPQWTTLNIGDSRVYLVRDDAIAQVTTDHSVVQELVAAGRLSPEEAEQHPYGNVITRAVGPSDGVTPDYVRLDVVDGDRFVICSDGLTKELTDYGILHFLLENDDPAAAVDAMMQAALENGGRDNVTIIVLTAAFAGQGDASADAETTGAQPTDAATADAAPSAAGSSPDAD